MTTKLEAYNQKRNFGNTQEPQGIREQPQEHLRFVVQHHMARREHYDLRLEWNGVLLSWAVPKGPSYSPKDKRLAVQVEDHPLEYRNFEGTIPQGEYGGGVVMLWDEGYWEPLLPVEDGLGTGSLKFELKGSRLKGKWALVRMKSKSKTGETSNNWLLLKEKDEYVQTHAGIEEFTTSVRTGRTMEEIEKGVAEKIVKNPFSKTEVQLAKLVSTIPKGEDWLYEVKYDGYRILAYLEGNKARLITRNGNDYTHRFPDVAYALVSWASGRAMVLDGEMVITDESGRPDFQALQSYMKSPKGKAPTYILFDLLALDGEDWRGRPLLERKGTLEQLMTNAPKNLHYSQHIRGKGKESYLAACEANLEGIIGKKANSLYTGTRSDAWIKLKCKARQEFVIGGYTLSEKKTWGVSALLLGVYEGDDLIYVGRAGTGMTQRVMKDLEQQFEKLKRATSPFKEAPEGRKNEKITWLEPQLIAEIEFAEWTAEHLLRQASFKGLRADKDPKTVKREVIAYQTKLEEVDSPMEETLEPRAGETSRNSSHQGAMVEGIKITNPTKILYENPKITKMDVVRYYQQVGERMMPYVGHRLLSIVRCPKGISASCFYKKHPGPGHRAIVPMVIENSEGETAEYFYIADTSGLIYEAQMGTLEFHIWGSRVDHLETPDMMVFDLDPDEGMDLETVRQGVRDLRSVLEQLSLTCYLKTSGGKGYHVVVPFQPAVGWDPFYDFARRVAEVMEQQWPDRYTSNMRKKQRVNKIFIDWVRNGRGATSIAPYSIRAREGAPVSMPILWEELDQVAPDGIKMEEALKRLKKEDPWKGFFQTQQRLK